MSRENPTFVRRASFAAAPWPCLLLASCLAAPRSGEQLAHADDPVVIEGVVEHADQPVVIEGYDHVARRYDWQHGILTARSDQRGRRMLVASLICPLRRSWPASPGSRPFEGTL